MGGRLTAVWLALSAIAVGQLWMGSLDPRDALRPDAAVTAGAIVVAFVKVRIILRELMEVRHAPRLLRRLTDLWVVLASVSLLGCYFAGMAFGKG